MTLAKNLGIYNQSSAQKPAQLIEQHAPLVKKIALHLMARLPASVQLELNESGELPIEQTETQDNPLEGLSSDAFRRSLAEAIEDLPEREKLVLSLYYQEELNLKEIGAVLGVSESRVSQIHSQAALRLRGRLSDWRQESDN